MDAAISRPSKLSTASRTGGIEGVAIIHLEARNRRPKQETDLSRPPHSAGIAVSNTGHGRAESNVAKNRRRRDSRNRNGTPPLGVADGRGRCSHT